ncbi:MAG: hypothetical protein DMG57_23685 [Acidobacteria bacterium]|nr:MAG: hypothetical protein DMG57_23685 [Acidobacteriota bacterium]
MAVSDQARCASYLSPVTDNFATCSAGAFVALNPTTLPQKKPHGKTDNNKTFSGEWEVPLTSFPGRQGLIFVAAQK